MNDIMSDILEEYEGVDNKDVYIKVFLRKLASGYSVKEIIKDELHLDYEKFIRIAKDELEGRTIPDSSIEDNNKGIK